MTGPAVGDRVRHKMFGRIAGRVTEVQPYGWVRVVLDNGQPVGFPANCWIREPAPAAQ